MYFSDTPVQNRSWMSHKHCSDHPMQWNGHNAHCLRVEIAFIKSGKLFSQQKKSQVASHFTKRHLSSHSQSCVFHKTESSVFMPFCYSKWLFLCEEIQCPRGHNSPGDPTNMLANWHRAYRIERMLIHLTNVSITELLLLLSTWTWRQKVNFSLLFFFAFQTKIKLLSFLPSWHCVISIVK